MSTINRRSNRLVGISRYNDKHSSIGTIVNQLFHTKCLLIRTLFLSADLAKISLIKIRRGNKKPIDLLLCFPTHLALTTHFYAEELLALAILQYGCMCKSLIIWVIYISYLISLYIILYR